MKKIFTLIVMLAAVLGMQAQDTWTIAGDETLMGEGWKPASTVNVMTTTDNIALHLSQGERDVEGKHILL